MRTMIQVAAREIDERRSALVAAFVAGLLPLLVPLLPWVRTDAPSARGITAFSTTLAMGLGFALALGGTVLVRDLVEGRLTFFFSRPISAVAIWSGKLLAAVVLTAAAIVLCLLPVTLVDGVHLGGMLTSTEVLEFGSALALTGVFLILVAHAVTTSVRTRSLWLAVDFMLAVVCSALAAGAFASIFYVTTSIRGGLEFGPFKNASVFLLASIVAALLAASYVQVAKGRTDATRAHGAFSATFWSVLLSALVAICAYALYVKNAPLSSIVAIEWSEAPAHGSWSIIGGNVDQRRGGYLTTFLVDADSGRSIPMGPHVGEVAFSADGRRSAWTTAEVSIRGDMTWRLFTCDLSSAHPVPGAPLLLPTGWYTLALSADGSRVAASDAATLSVYDVATSRLLASARYASDQRFSGPGLSFVSNDVVRAFIRPQGSRTNPNVHLDLEIRELNVAKKSLATVAKIPSSMASPFPPRALTLRGTDHILFVEGKGERVTLRDGKGGVLSTLYESTARDQGIGNALLRADGGLILTEFGDKGSRLLSFSADGKLLGTLPLPDYRRLRFIAEGENGKLFLTGQSLKADPLQPAADASASKLFALDIASGVVKPVCEGVIGVAFLDFWRSVSLGPVSSRDDRARLFISKEHALVRIDLETGARKVIAGPGA